MRLRDELLSGEIFYTLKEAQLLVEAWRHHYNAVRAHSNLGCANGGKRYVAQAFRRGPLGV